MKVASGTLLAPHDPAPVRVYRPDGRSAVLLTVEHAGNAVPHALADLGLSSTDLTRHIAHDPGAALLARAIADRLDATALLQPYSRLVIDCNRPLDAHDLILAESDGTVAPANVGLSEQARAARVAEIHAPFHGAVSALIDQRMAAGRPPCIVSVHSFTPVLGGKPRPWDIGLLHDPADTRLADGMADRLARTDLCIGRNQPYDINRFEDYTIPIHGIDRGLPNLLIEVRQDHLARPEDIAAFGDLLSDALGSALRNLPPVP